MNYWQKQTAESPLFPDVEWNKPERRDQIANVVDAAAAILDASSAISP